MLSLVQGPMSLAAVPCTYWFDNSWYDLTNIASFGSTNFWTSPANEQDTLVSFNFCQKLSAGSDLEPLACPDLDLYAIEHTKATSVRPLIQCAPLSTSSLSSVHSTSFTGSVGDSEFEDNLAIKYTKDQCSLIVVLNCNDNEDNPEISPPYKLDESHPC